VERQAIFGCFEKTKHNEEIQLKNFINNSVDNLLTDNLFQRRNFNAFRR